MAVKYETNEEGRKIKLYPAFNTEAHAHDIEFRRNRLENEIYASIFHETDTEGRYKKLSKKEMEEAERLSEKLQEILGRLSWPTTYLPWELYSIARETIGWAACARSR